MKRVFLAVLVFVFALTSVPAFAESGVTNTKAVFIFTDKNNNAVTPEFDYFTNDYFLEEGSKIRIYLDGVVDSSPDKEYIYNKDSFGEEEFFFPLKLEKTGNGYANQTVLFRAYEYNDITNPDRGKLYEIQSNVKVIPIRAPMKSFSYTPSLVNVASESIKEGNAYYLYKRALHSNGKRSSFADGEKITVYFEDGTSKDYVNQVVGSRDKFVNGNGEKISVQATNYSMKLGMNDVTLKLLVHPVKVKSDTQAKPQTFIWKVYVKKPGEADYAANTPKSSSSAKKTVSTAKKTSKVAINVKNLKAGRTGRRFNVSWKALTKTQRTYVSKIQIQYSNNKQFKSPKNVWVKNNQKKYVSKKLKKGKYYIRARCMRKVGNKQYYSKWSAVVKVKIR